MTPLVNSNTNVENFAPTGAEGVPNAPLFIPYQGEHFTEQLAACAHACPAPPSFHGCLGMADLNIQSVGFVTAGGPEC